MKKLLIIVIFSITNSFISQSQTAYIETDQKLLTGVILKSGTEIDNSQFITQIKNGKEIKYTANELISYQLADGRKYISSQLPLSNNEHVFLEVLVEGENNLYYFRDPNSKRYLFSEPSNEKLLAVSKSALVALGNTLASDCPEIKKALNLVHINRNSLIRFFSGLNNCNFFPFHRAKIGVNFGLSQLKFVNNRVSNRYLADGEYDYDNNYSLGLFVEIPIGLTAMKFLSGINYVRHELSNEYNGLAGEVSTSIDFQSINIPLYFKYNLRDDKMLRPFYQFGLTFDHLFQKSNNIEAQPREINNAGEIIIVPVGEDANENFISKNYYGLLIGIGAEFNLNYKSEIKTEINYTYRAGSVNTLNMTSFNYIISYVF